MKKDDKAVSPVIAVIMLIAITVIIAAVVAAFAYGIIGGVKKAPSAALIVENARAGETNITVVHHGGDPIIDAFGTSPSWSFRYQGKECILGEDNAKLNGGDLPTTNTPFKPGDELVIDIIAASGSTGAFSSGESITIVYMTGDVLQRLYIS
ncbi:MAG TPA: type IV pilin [Methanomicrobia archaeon]|nr:type IV pilin [Methanomicrobia archaeon]